MTEDEDRTMNGWISKRMIIAMQMKSRTLMILHITIFKNYTN